MNRSSAVTLAGCALYLTLAGCASQGTRRAPGEGGVTFDRGATVISGPALEDGPGSVLAALTGKVPNFRVNRNAYECPEIALRNNVSYNGPVNPHIYVDGTRATDTCILESLRGSDVERVEVYPMGFTHRPGYGTHAHGLILVFMRVTAPAP
jgi:hypothetical protein